MKKITFLANKESVHVKRWIEVVGRAGYKLRIIDLSLPSILKVFKYVFLGLLVRFKKNLGIVHAHSALGYGLAAWISGKDYVVTVYGTEVFGSLDSILKTNMLKNIFKKAKKISCTTKEMEDLLVENFFVDREKISMFSMGVSDVFFQMKEDEKTKKINRVTFFHNRRFHPHYNIEMLLDAFFEVKKKFPEARMKLASGDADHVYMDEIKRKYTGMRGVKYLGKKSLAGMAEELSSSDFAISIPKSDQFSASILESMACGAIPVLASLQAYDRLKLVSKCIFIDSLSVGSLVKAMIEAIELSEADKAEMVEFNRGYVERHESSTAVMTKVADLYAGLYENR